MLWHRLCSDHRLIVLVLVTGMHVVLLLALLTLRHERQQAGDVRVSTLVFLANLEPVKQELGFAPQLDYRQEILYWPPTWLTFDNTPSSIETSPPGAAPDIDWKQQASQSAATVVDETIQRETRKCKASDADPAWLPRCEQPPPPQFDWAPPRSGFSGGLPFIMLGERCVVGLGFFGCGLGAKPPANGDLFEHMRDPDRDRSSVPDPNATQRQR